MITIKTKTKTKTKTTITITITITHSAMQATTHCISLGSTSSICTVVRL